MGKAVKRCLGTLACLLILSLLFLVLWPIALGPLANDWAADRLEREFVAGLELSPGETLVESAAWAGNSSGTGDHTELWAGVLLRYTGPEETARGTPIEAITGWHLLPASDFPRTADVEELFPALSGLEDWAGYYILGTYGTAVTQLDIRGC